MTLSSSELSNVLSELSVFLGAKLQRIDVPEEQEIVFEFRVPGQTLWILASVRPTVGRIHLIEGRPQRKIPPGKLQGILRTQLVGQFLVHMEAKSRIVQLVFEKAVLRLDINGGKKAIQLSTIVEEKYEQPIATAKEKLPDFSYSHTIAQRYADKLPDARKKYLQDRIKSNLLSKRKKLKKLYDNISKDKKRLEALLEYQHQGELLKTVLHKVKRGDVSVTVLDWMSGQEVDLALEPQLSSTANLERLFSKAKKANRGIPVVTQRLERTQQQLDEIDYSLLELEESDDQESLDAFAADVGIIADGVIQVGNSENKAKRKKEPIDVVSRGFQSQDGTEIRVGRGAEANDRLTFTFARGDDLWLHVRGIPGAHVIVRLNKGAQAANETILDAAHLAIYYSDAKNETKAEVIVAQARHVKKTKGAPAGRVGVSDSRTVLIRMESDRLDRLMERDV